MRRNFLNTIIFALGIVLFFISCKKEINTRQTASPKITSQNQKILDMIHHFKANLNAQLKDGETMIIDSAVWYIEATMNETYARADSLKNIIYIDSAYVEVPINPDQTVNSSDIDSAYNECVYNLSVFYHSFTGDPGVLFVDISLAKVYSDHIKLKETMVICKPGTNYVWFGATDNWYWGEGRGKCDGTQFGKDASTELTQHANWSIPYPGPGVFYVSLYTTDPISPWDVELPSGTSNPFGYWADYLFGNGSDVIPEYHECLTYDVMNYYLGNIFVIADLYKPQDLFAVNYECEDDETVGTGYWTHIHKLKISYGLGVTEEGPPIDPPPLP